MELKNQVVSLELAKRLKEVGVKQHAHFWWSMPNPQKADSNANKLGLAQASVQLTHMHYGVNFNEYAAFTVAELGEMLPRRLRLKHEEHIWADYQPFFQKDDVNVEYSTRYFRDDRTNKKNHIYHGPLILGQQSDKTEADARAKMLIYLIENKLITP